MATSGASPATNVTVSRMTDAVVAVPPRPSARVAGGGVFPVGRIFCVGRNYAEHAKEMGAAADAVFFMKPAEAVRCEADAIPYPDDTERLDHEIELALALGAGGRPQTEAQARALIWGYGAAVDLTRRDVQARAKAAGGPWEASKAFDASAPLSLLAPTAAIGHPRTGRIWLAVDGATRQDADLAQMLLTPEALLVALGRVWTLQPGDLVLTGTPAGVGPCPRGARITGGVAGVGAVDFRIA